MKHYLHTGTSIFSKLSIFFYLKCLDVLEGVAFQKFGVGAPPKVLVGWFITPSQTQVNIL